MTTDYNAIAAQYRQAKQQPWRTFIERPSLLALVGDVKGKRIVDLACGEGYYTRELARRGAARIVGVDLSSGMVDLARSQEATDQLGVEYLVSDVRALALRETFDVAVAAYLLNYAHDRRELAAMVG